MGGPDGRHGLDNVAQETIAVFDAASVRIVSLIGFGLEELVDQVAIRGVDFHAVEAGGSARSAARR